MRYVIFSDVHANIEALNAMLAHASRKRKDAWVFLGDAVGYGAAPNQVVERLRRLRGRVLAVRGNHDRVVLDPSAGIDFFNDHARLAARWTSVVLQPANRRWLAALPSGPIWLEEGVAACHGAPQDEDAYIFTDVDALESLFALPEAWVIFFGHSHVPSMFELRQEGREAHLAFTFLRGGERLELMLSRQRRYLINVGAVGQPRDRDWRPSYGLFDSGSGKLTVYRLVYDAQAARKRIIDAGLPAILGDHLVRGF
ncbi:MAG: metallophosphoesterase family protein [Thermoanaerobaculum sp.]|nr:metallophosphoesterase family protein [Thermoanaerobaculum sp.]